MKGLVIKLTLLCSLALTFALYAGCCGKVDIGPMIFDLDILKSGHTEETLHMKGVKGDATIQLYKALVLKPGFIWGQGHGEVASGSIGLGLCTPIFKGFMLIPSAGVIFGYVRTKVDVPIPEMDIVLKDLKERFRSISPYVALEFCYTFLEKWSIMGCYQYSWSRTHTKIGDIVSENSHCWGPNYTLGLEYCFNKNWAMNLGAGYNTSLSKEKHGIRGKGLKLGVAYYF